MEDLISVKSLGTNSSKSFMVVRRSFESGPLKNQQTIYEAVCLDHDRSKAIATEAYLIKMHYLSLAYCALCLENGAPT